jgi:signal transduction histidine kinase
MSGSIRNQILIPLVAIQVVTVAAVTAAVAIEASRRAGLAMVERVSGVVGVIREAQFPLTPNVLDRLERLSGAEFATLGPDGRVQTSTLTAMSGRIVDVQTVPDDLSSFPRGATIAVGGRPYYGLIVPTADPSPDASRLLVLYSERAWRQARLQAAVGPLSVGLASLSLLAAVTGWVALRIARRIRHVEVQVARIADGDLAPVQPVTGRDEVASLARSVNRMAERLGEMQTAIRRSERSRLLSQLAAGWAHQLRNALTGARISVQLHARRCDHRDDEALHVALRQLEITEDYVRGLLDLGKPEARPRTVERLICDASLLAAEVVRLARPIGMHAGVSLTINSEGDDQAGGPSFLGDAAAVRAAVLNLIINAIEATGSGGSVGLCLRDEPRTGWIWFDVTDDGPGPPPSLGDSVFEPFVTGKPEGVGLGLAVARQVAEQHGGELSWDRVDGQTRFRLVLPQHPRPPAAPDPISRPTSAAV